MESERDVENLQSTLATFKDKERNLSRQLESKEQELKLKQSELDR
jgi:chromosome segregation ATPase